VIESIDRSTAVGQISNIYTWFCIASSTRLEHQHLTSHLSEPSTSSFIFSTIIHIHSHKPRVEHQQAQSSSYFVPHTNQLQNLNNSLFPLCVYGDVCAMYGKSCQYFSYFFNVYIFFLLVQLLTYFLQFSLSLAPRLDLFAYLH